MYRSNLLITYRSTTSGRCMRERGSGCGFFIIFHNELDWFNIHWILVQFYYKDINSCQFECDNIFNKQARNFRSAQVCGSQTMLFHDACKERQRAKFDREQAELAVYLQQPFLLSSDYNCAFQEERIWDKSSNTGHELASFCSQMIM